MSSVCKLQSFVCLKVGGAYSYHNNLSAVISHEENVKALCDLILYSTGIAVSIPVILIRVFIVSYCFKRQENDDRPIICSTNPIALQLWRYNSMHS